MLQFLDNRSETSLTALGLALVAVVGAVDYFTGPDYSFSLFYLLPVALVAWYANRRLGIMVSVLSAMVWLVADVAARPEGYPAPLLPLWNASIRLGFFLTCAVLLTALRRSLDYEKVSARTDYLTGAANSRAFYDLANLEIKRAERYGHPFSVAYIDLDDFKAINDRFGHSVGDTVLRTVVEVLKSSLRASDVVARLGGDEFAILLPESGPESVQAVGDRIRATLSDAIHRHGWPLTFSMGLLTCVEPPRSIDELLREVDRLMYAVKESGKDSVRYGVLPHVG